jgi:predicted Zn-dependent protease
MIVQSLGRMDDAQQRYEAIVGRDRHAAVAANNLAWIYAERGLNLDTALELARTARDELPESPEVADTLGFIYLQKNLPEMAIPLLRESTMRRPAHAGSRLRLGLAYAQTGDRAAARRELERVIAAKGDGRTEQEARRALEALGSH